MLEHATEVLLVNASVQSVAGYEYDGLGRRVVKHVYDAGSYDYSDHFYYTGWQCIEVRRDDDGGTKDDETPQNLPLLEQFVYHPYYIDAVAVRYYNDDLDNGTTAQKLQYLLHDAQFNVIALLDDTGAELERYRYTPYGQQIVMDGSFDDDYDSDGDPADNVSQYGQQIGFTGQRLDEESGLWYFKGRYYSEGLGQFLRADVKGYIDGMNLRAGWFAAVGGMDPFGFERVLTQEFSVTGHVLWQDSHKNIGGRGYAIDRPNGKFAVSGLNRFSYINEEWSIDHIVRFEEDLDGDKGWINSNFPVGNLGSSLNGVASEQQWRTVHAVSNGRYEVLNNTAMNTLYGIDNKIDERVITTNYNEGDDSFTVPVKITTVVSPTDECPVGQGYLVTVYASVKSSLALGQSSIGQGKLEIDWDLSYGPFSLGRSGGTTTGRVTTPFGSVGGGYTYEPAPKHEGRNAFERAHYAQTYIVCGCPFRAVRLDGNAHSDYDRTGRFDGVWITGEPGMQGFDVPSRDAVTDRLLQETSNR